MLKVKEHSVTIRNLVAAWQGGESHFDFIILAYRGSRFNLQASQFEKTDYLLQIFCNSMAVIYSFRNNSNLLNTLFVNNIMNCQTGYGVKCYILKRICN